MNILDALNGDLFTKATSTDDSTRPLVSANKAASYEERRGSARREAATIFNSDLTVIMEEWLQWQVIHDCLSLLSPFLKPAVIPAQPTRELYEPSNSRRILAQLVTSLTRDVTIDQLAARMPDYEAGSPNSAKFSNLLGDFVSVLVKMELVQRIQQANGNHRYILACMPTLIKDVIASTPYSGVLLIKSRSQLIDLDNGDKMLYVPARYVMVNNPVTGKKERTLVQAKFEMPVKAGTTVTRALYLAAGAKQAALWKQSIFDMEIEAKKKEILKNPLKDVLSIEYDILERMRTPYDISQALEIGENNPFKALENEDGRNRSTALGFSFLSDKDIRAFLMLAGAPAGSRFYFQDFNGHAIRGSATLESGYSSVLMDGETQTEAEKLGVHGLGNDPYLYAMEMISDILKAQIESWYNSPAGLTARVLFPDFKTFIRTLVKFGITPLCYGSGIATASRSIVENCGLSQDLADRVAQSLGRFIPLKRYLQTVQRGDNLNTSHTYTASTTLRKVTLTRDFTLENSYNRVEVREGNTLLFWVEKTCDSKARTAIAANLTQHFEAFVKCFLHLYAQHKQKTSKTKAEALQWVLVSTHDSFGMLNQENLFELMSLVPEIENQFLFTVRDKLAAQFGIAFPNAPKAVPLDAVYWKPDGDEHLTRAEQLESVLHTLESRVKQLKLDLGR